MNIGDVDIRTCCRLFLGNQACYDQCMNVSVIHCGRTCGNNFHFILQIHDTTPNDLLNPVLRNCSPESFVSF